MKQIRNFREVDRSLSCTQIELACEMPYLGAAEEERKREGPVGMGCIFELNIPELRYCP